MVAYKYKEIKDDKLFAYVMNKTFHEKSACLDIARTIHIQVTQLRNMTDEEIRIQHLKDSPFVLKDEVYMKLEETLDALEHICSQDQEMERWNDGIAIVDSYLFQINYRKMSEETYESLRKSTVEGILAEIMTNRTKTNSLPC